MIFADSQSILNQLLLILTPPRLGRHLKCWPDMAEVSAGRVSITYSILIIIEYIAIW